MGVDYHTYGGYGFEVSGSSDVLDDLLNYGVESEYVDLIYSGHSGDRDFALVLRESVVCVGLEMDSVGCDFVNDESNGLLYQEAERLGLKPKHKPRFVVAGYLSC